ncbi:MAG: FAD-dependent oxidoreductase [Reichenbachiella sp.]
MREKVIIIGGGIAGLTAAYALKKQGLNPLVLESNSRLGGRIYTKIVDSQSFELGATWVFQDVVLKQLITELGLKLYPQYLTGDALIKYEPSMAIQRNPTDSLMNGASYHKVKGGTGAIIQALADQLDPQRILVNTKVVSLDYQKESIVLTMVDGSKLETAKVILAVPPKVIADQIEINPRLDHQGLMLSTHTWMGESTKFTVLLDRDYWRKNKLSGFVYSNYGLIREMQDHSDGDSFGLLGFIHPTGILLVDIDKRKQLVIQELKELFGIDERHILGYDDFLWGEYFVDGQQHNYNTDLMPHQNNGHAFYLQSHFDDHLFFAGAETSPSNPGYMEGAVCSAYRAVKLLLGVS